VYAWIDFIHLQVAFKVDWFENSSVNVLVLNGIVELSLSSWLED